VDGFLRVKWPNQQCQSTKGQKKSSGLYGARGDIRGRHTDNPAGHHSIRTNQRPTSLIPPFLCQMPFLLQPSQFILAWDRRQICWLAYPLAWLWHSAGKSWSKCLLRLEILSSSVEYLDIFFFLDTCCVACCSIRQWTLHVSSWRLLLQCTFRRRCRHRCRCLRLRFQGSQRRALHSCSARSRSVAKRPTARRNLRRKKMHLKVRGTDLVVIPEVMKLPINA